MTESFVLQQLVSNIPHDITSIDAFNKISNSIKQIRNRGVTPSQHKDLDVALLFLTTGIRRDNCADIEPFFKRLEMSQRPTDTGIIFVNCLMLSAYRDSPQCFETLVKLRESFVLTPPVIQILVHRTSLRCIDVLCRLQRVDFHVFSSYIISSGNADVLRLIVQKINRETANAALWLETAIRVHDESSIETILKEFRFDTAEQLTEPFITALTIDLIAARHILLELKEKIDINPLFLRIKERFLASKEDSVENALCNFLSIISYDHVNVQTFMSLFDSKKAAAQFLWTLSNKTDRGYALVSGIVAILDDKQGQEILALFEDPAFRSHVISGTIVLLIRKNLVARAQSFLDNVKSMLTSYDQTLLLLQFINENSSNGIETVGVLVDIPILMLALTRACQNEKGNSVVSLVMLLEKRLGSKAKSTISHILFAYGLKHLSSHVQS